MRKRSIVICAEDTPAAAYACNWAVDHLYREGDVFHLVYVIKSLKPPMEVYHGLPGTSFSFSRPGKHHEGDVIISAKTAIEHRYLPVLKTKMVPYELHLYAEKIDVAPKKVGEIILNCVEERDACLVVIAAHNKPSSSDRDRWEGEVGSVTSYIIKNCKRPLGIVQPRKMTEQVSVVS